MASEGAQAPSDASSMPIAAWWLGGFVALLSIVATISSIYNNLRPRPPFAKQFAPINHGHDEYVKQAAFDAIQEQIRAERKSEFIEGQRREERLWEKIDEVGKSITTAVVNLSKEAEIRSSAMHKRLNPIAEQVAANRNTLDNHLSDHRREASHGH